MSHNLFNDELLFVPRFFDFFLKTWFNKDGKTWFEETARYGTFLPVCYSIRPHKAEVYQVKFLVLNAVSFEKRCSV